MNKFQKLLQKYLKGDCTPGEIETIHDWYDSFEQDRSPWDDMPAETQQIIKRRLLMNIRTKTALKTTQTGPVRPARTLIYSLSGIVAAFVIVALAFIFYQKEPAVLSSLSGVKVVSNNTHSIRKVSLTDGSIVWLNPGSRIEYPEKFAAARRSVKMKGEAFFEVTPDKKRPFIITSGKVITRVWGTSFRIRAYQKQPVEVSVVTGKVSVRLDEEDSSEVMLLPDQKATYISERHVLRKHPELKSSAIRIWKKTTLSFDNAPIKEVIDSLNSSFDAHIRSDDKQLLSYVLKADFTDQSLPAILEMLEKSLDLKYSLHNSEIILTTNNTNYN